MRRLVIMLTVLWVNVLVYAQTKVRPAPFIGLEMRGSYLQIIDSNTDPNAYRLTLTAIPEFGFQFNNDLFVSICAGVTETLWNYEHSSSKYNWFAITTGLKAIKQFPINEYANYYLGVESNYWQQNYRIEANGRDETITSKYLTTALSNGISFTVAERFNIIPMVVLSHRNPWQNDRLENGFANITITPVIRFRYNFIERTT